MPTRKEMDAVQSRIEALSGDRFWANGEFLRPVGGDQPGAGTPWNELEFEDRREAVYVNTDWKGFSLEEQMEVTDRVADGDPSGLWLEGIRASDHAEHTRALITEMAEERRVASGEPSSEEPGSEQLRSILAGTSKLADSPAVQPEIERAR